MAVPITEEEKLSPVYKYIRDYEMTEPDYDLIAATSVPMDPSELLHPKDMNRIFEPGFLPRKIGYAQFEDGTVGLYNTLFMPGVTPEMFDWWFVFKGLDPLHYKIWDKQNHYFTSTDSPERSRDKSIPLRERIWNNTHFNQESFYEGGPVEDLTLTFRNPANVGFDAEKLYGSGGTIVCSGDEKQVIITSHYMQPVAGGCQLHTHFWWGWHVVDRKLVKAIPDGTAFPIDVPKRLLEHNIREMSHLRTILPSVFADFHDMLI